ncbi:MAG: UDP-glucuronic acid decarboxylase family protein [Candidatus Sericytochromatia bacterium]
MNKKILITGGAGFIGSHLAKDLLTRGNKVTVLDNFFTGSKNNLLDVLDNPNFTLIEHDIIEPFSLDVDEIYNLACPASPVHYQYDPIKTMKTNFNGMLNMLELAKKNKAKILQASTSEVYGDPEVHPQKENYRGCVNPIGIRACYDEGKRIAETLCFDFYRQYQVEVRVIRIFNTYGPNMLENDGRVVSNFIVQCLKNEDITVYGEGAQTRSFCYVSDLVSGMIKMMENSQSFIGPVNLGRPSENTVLEIANKIKEMTNSSSNIIFKELPKDDPTRRKPDISLAKEKLNWEPVVNLEDGLAKTIEYFAKIKSI